MATAIEVNGVDRTVDVDCDTSLLWALVAAEVFSATHPSSNQKLKKDLARLCADLARHRYVFFAAPGYAAGRQEELEKTAPGIQVYAVVP